MEGLRLKEVVPLIVGEEGTPVKIGVLKEGDENVQYITLFRRGAKKLPEAPVPKAEPPKEKIVRLRSLPDPVSNLLIKQAHIFTLLLVDSRMRHPGVIQPQNLHASRTSIAAKSGKARL